MKDKRLVRSIRWLLSVILVVAGLSVTWAWGQVARLAEPLPAVEFQPSPLYAAWQPADAEQPGLFRSLDEGATWQPLALPEGAAPVAWAYDGGNRLAVALDDGALLRSEDRGDAWAGVAAGLPVLSLAWGDGGDLYLGTEEQDVYRLAADGSLTTMTATPEDLARSPVQHLAWVAGRLYAATPTLLFHTDDDGQTWGQSAPVPGGISALAATGRSMVFAGSGTDGVYRSADAGQTWQPALEGLGLAAGQMVQITALRADPQEPGLLYAAVSYGVGSTHIHFSAMGTFVTLNSGTAWQPLDGPAFPEAEHAADLVVAAGRPLYVQAVTVDGLQGYTPNVAAALDALESDEGSSRASAARLVGLARAQEAGDALLAALADPEPAVGLAAAEALGRIADPGTAGSLLVALEHPEEQVRLNAARALGMMGAEAAVEPLRAMLLAGSRLEIRMAGEALGRIGSPAAVDALLAALAVPAPTARWHVAMSALETMGEPATGPLAAALEGENVYLRRSAAQALGWIGSPAATATLVEALTDEDEQVRGQAAWALGEVGDPAARTALERVQTRDTAATVQAAAGAALVRIEQHPVVAAGWPATWAPALQQLQGVRWLILALSLAGAAWLAMSNTQLVFLPALQRTARR